MRCSGLILVTLALLAGIAPSARALDPARPPSGNFDLTHWKLHLPVNQDGGDSGAAASIAPAGQPHGLRDYARPPLFFTASDGAMVLFCPAKGAKTSTTRFPRCELREMIDPANDAVNWTLDGHHILMATCRVTRLSTAGATYIGQIHGVTATGGSAYPFVKLKFERTARGYQIRAMCKRDATHDDDDTMIFPGVTADLNRDITYAIIVRDRTLKVVVDGVTGVIAQKNANPDGSYASSPTWAEQHLLFYFKAGNYNQDSSRDDSACSVQFYALQAAHTGVRTSW
jgi:hypothetical protein